MQATLCMYQGLLSCDATVSRTREPCLYLKNKNNTWIEYSKKYLVSDPTIRVRCKHMQSWVRPIIPIYIPLGDYPKRVIGCVFTVLHTAHTCEYGPTSRFAYLLGPFLGWDNILGSCCWTPVRYSDCRNIMINIMIIFLPHNVHIHTIIKRGVFPDAWTHNDAWSPNVFLSSNTTSFRFPSYHIIFIITFHAYIGVMHHVEASYCMSIIFNILSCQTCVIR